MGIQEKQTYQKVTAHKEQDIEVKLLGSLLSDNYSHVHNIIF
jgi:hypothetical protein